MAHTRNREQASWISRAMDEIEHEDELLECRRIVLKIVRYMKDNHLTQKELACRLNVTPQYVNKLLHGQDLDLKVTTVVRYGKLLGIKLLEVPDENTGKEVSAIQYIINHRVNENAVQPSEFIYPKTLSRTEEISNIRIISYGSNQISS